MATGQARVSYRYLYERLGDKRFQEMCGALLSNLYPHVTCYPVGQSDGGRDIVLKNGGHAIIYQVKWTSKPQQNPVAWLDNAIKGEAASIRQLVGAGAQEYCLLTSVAGTASPGRGTMDKLDKRLEAHSRNFGIRMECWWRDDIDARIDIAPKELKWTYQEMLAGVDAVRYLIEAEDLAATEQELRSLLLKVLATQWQEDSKVKFKQVELESHNLTDLFVDVEATRISHPNRLTGLHLDATATLTPNERGKTLGGAAAYLLSAKQPLTLVRGEASRVRGSQLLGNFSARCIAASSSPTTPTDRAPPRR